MPIHLLASTFPFVSQEANANLQPLSRAQPCIQHPESENSWEQGSSKLRVDVTNQETKEIMATHADVRNARP